MIYLTSANSADLKAALKEQPVKHFVRKWPTSTRVMFVKTTKQDAIEALVLLTQAGFCNVIGKPLVAQDLSTSVPGTFSCSVFKRLEPKRVA